MRYSWININPLKDFEKGLNLFTYPAAFDIWNVYLPKFIAGHGGYKLERARDLFEEARKDCPGKFIKTLSLMYAKMEEDQGLVKRAMYIYLKAATSAVLEDRSQLYNICVTNALSFLLLKLKYKHGSYLCSNFFTALSNGINWQ
jgi:pre-mRNA-splicing factor SYF1